VKPYYQDNAVTIYHGDCREILPGLELVDLVLTDPPYGLAWGGTGFTRIKYTNWHEAAEWDKRPSSYLFQIIKNRGKECIIWGGNYFAESLGSFVSPLIWDKMTGANTFADGELAWTSFKKGTLRIFRHQWCGVFKDSERGAINFHPTQKPIALMTWCIEQADNPQTILDPFMGSGTTLRAAKDLGRKAIGIEIEEKYCEIAARRMAQEVLALG